MLKCWGCLYISSCTLRTRQNFIELLNTNHDLINVCLAEMKRIPVTCTKRYCSCEIVVCLVTIFCEAQLLCAELLFVLSSSMKLGLVWLVTFFNVLPFVLRQLYENVPAIIQIFVQIQGVSLKEIWMTNQIMIIGNMNDLLTGKVLLNDYCIKIPNSCVRSQRQMMCNDG